MLAKPRYLESNHLYNFRHREENPKIIELVPFTPENGTERPCYKVLYESDGTIDYIAEESVSHGEWSIIS